MRDDTVKDREQKSLQNAIPNIWKWQKNQNCFHQNN